MNTMSYNQKPVLRLIPDVILLHQAQNTTSYFAAPYYLMAQVFIVFEIFKLRSC